MILFNRQKTKTVPPVFKSIIATNVDIDQEFIDIFESQSTLDIIYKATQLLLLVANNKEIQIYKYLTPNNIMTGLVNAFYALYTGVDYSIPTRLIHKPTKAMLHIGKDEEPVNDILGFMTANLQHPFIMNAFTTNFMRHIGLNFTPTPYYKSACISPIIRPLAIPTNLDMLNFDLRILNGKASKSGTIDPIIHHVDTTSYEPEAKIYALPTEVKSKLSTLEKNEKYLTRYKHEFNVPKFIYRISS